jgi:hypothetical protein
MRGEVGGKNNDGEESGWRRRIWSLHLQLAAEAIVRQAVVIFYEDRAFHGSERAGYFVAPTTDTRTQ